jgi:mono/diheme cytochrome c family protein
MKGMSQLPARRTSHLEGGKYGTASPDEFEMQETPDLIFEHGRQLTDAEIAAVLTYVRNSWGGAAAAVPAEDVTNARSALASRWD